MQRFRLVLLVVASFVSSAGAVESPSTIIPPRALGHALSDVTWSSRASDLQSLGDEIARFYLSLCTTNQLPMQEVVDEKGQSVEQTLRDRQLFFGKGFPEALDELMCAQNADLCNSKRTTRHASSQVLRCGPAISRRDTSRYPSWVNRPGSKIRVPNVPLEVEVQFQPRSVKPGDTVETLLQERAYECSFFKVIPCLKAVQQENGLIWQQLSNGTYSGQIYLPALNVSTKLNLEEHPVLFNKLKSNLSVPTTIQKHSFASTTSTEDRATLDASRAKIAAALGVPDSGVKSDGSVTVGILDGWTDDQHCLINYKLTKVHNSGSFTFKRNDCGLVTKSFDVDEEHATHLLGMLAATSELIDGKRSPIIPIVAGLRVNTYQLNQNPFDPKVATQTLIGPTSGLTLLDPSDVYATSFTYGVYPGVGDEFGAWITQPKRRSLYVAASGKTVGSQPVVYSNVRPNSDCNFFPVCRSLDSPNVVSVVAFNDDLLHPEILQSTRYGIAFDVGAPGDAVPSTIRGNKIGVESGSSQSTIFVAGVAALMLEKDRNFSPIQIRNRLIATSDPFPFLYSSIFGGRVNASRALDLSDDVVIIKRESNVVYNGNSILAGNIPKDLITLDPKNPGAVILHGEMDRVCRIYLFNNDETHERDFGVNAFQFERFWRDRENNQIYIFYDKPPEKKVESLRVDRAVVRNHATEGARRFVHLSFQNCAAGPASLDVAVNDVEDLVARTQANPPEGDWNGTSCPK